MSFENWTEFLMEISMEFLMEIENEIEYRCPMIPPLSFLFGDNVIDERIVKIK